ncbi:helix-turn-helix transcriptional regulator [Polaromonas sp. DSR2-3-2]|uniref:helix-turn-helix transcriptional regulator n=1 Tax=unclassified Polaromonas TaxID=2638319 RepID=UPI003CE8B0A2
MNTFETAPPVGLGQVPTANKRAAVQVTDGPKPGAVDDTLYLTEELAAWLRISPAAIEKDRSLGRGSYPPFVKVGGRRVCYRHGDIMTWLHANRYNHDSTRAAPVR